LWTYQPDFVVLCNAWNDVKTFADLGDGKTLLRSVRPYVKRYDPRVDYRNALDRLLCEHSQVFVRLRRWWVKHSLPADEEGYIQQGPILDHVPPEGLAQYRMTLRVFADAARDAGATPVFMTQPTLVTANASPEDRKRIKYGQMRMTHAALAEALAACRRVMIEVAAEKHAPLIDANPALSGRSEFFRDHVHMSDVGYEALSALVATRLDAVLGQHDAPTSATRPVAGR
jgi:lysophospholipase L1-like esterase